MKNFISAAESYSAPFLRVVPMMSESAILYLSVTNGDNTIEGFIIDEGNVIEE